VYMSIYLHFGQETLTFLAPMVTDIFEPLH
jgi:hypothetical protein